MKSAHLIRRIHPANWGGTENVVSHLIQNLILAGNPAEVLATTALGGDSQEELMGCPVRRFNYTYPYWPLSQTAMRALDQKGGNPYVPQMENYLMQGDFDLIHTHNLGRIGESGLQAARSKDIPLVLSLHGGGLDIPAKEKNALLNPLRHTFPYGGIIDRLTGRRHDLLQEADMIVCVGENELGLLQKSYPNQKVRFVPNGVDFKYYQPASTFDWRSQLKLNSSTKLMLNISRIDYQKDQMILLQLLSQLKLHGEDVHLLLIGPVSSDTYLRKLTDYAKEKNLTQALTIIPGLHPLDEKLRSAYLQCDCFMLPSLHEPFGIAALEAWSAGAPLIASTAGGLGKLVKNQYTAITFCPGDLDSLLSAYQQSHDRSSSICANAKNEAQTKYDWSVIARQMLDLYNEVQNG